MPSYTKYAGSGSSSGGGYPWNNAGQIGSTSAPLAFALVNAPTPTQGSETLLASSFGFTIPSDETIVGIEVTFNKRADAANQVLDGVVQLTLGGDNKADGSYWPFPGNTDLVYGGASDLWSLTPTPADVNDSGFGVNLSISPDPTAAGTYGRAWKLRMTIYTTAIDKLVAESPVFPRRNRIRCIR